MVHNVVRRVRHQKRNKNNEQHQQNLVTPWGFLINLAKIKIVPACCSDCGNYMHQKGSTHQEIPCSIRCWKNYSGDCRRDPRKALVAQMKLRSVLIRNPDLTKECAICLNEMKCRYVRRIFCGHTFHPRCLEKWEEEKRSCPMCRFDYTPPRTHEEIIIDVSDSHDNFNFSYTVWHGLLLPMLSPEAGLPSEGDIEDLDGAFDEVIDNFDEFMLYHNEFREHVRDIPPSSHTVNNYRRACELMGPIILALQSIRSGDTEGVVCRDDAISHALERVILHMSRPMH